MIILSQRDPQWSMQHLGLSALTVGRYGCTTTCLSMLSDYFGHYMNPGKIASHMGWYDIQGEIEWQNLMIPGMKFASRLNARFDNVIQLNLKDPNKAVILQVDNGQHWVVALRKCWLSNDYVVADPWFGDKRTACGTYKNITGMALFERA